MLLAMVLIPVLAALGAVLVRGNALRRLLSVVAALAHAGLTGAAWVIRPEPQFGGWLMLDAAGFLTLNIVSAIFLAVSLYSAGYLSQSGHGREEDAEEAGAFFSNAPEAVFTACMLLLLAATTLASCSQHLGLFWVAMEAATLAAAPLIYYHRQHRSLEATWKYLLIGSVGISLALLGNSFLAISASFQPGEPIPLTLGSLSAHAKALNQPWLKAAFIFLLMGYGTKMGLAPMHTWKPDAYSEAPAVVAALLSGAMTNCAFLGILRAQQVCAAAGLADFGKGSLLVLGLFSLALAGTFIVGQSDYKRMLAYSSVEHMGILALGVGIGGAGCFGALLHALNNALAKPMLFFAAGNIRSVYRTKSTQAVTGVLRVLPVSGALLIAGCLASTGFPPFAVFLSELTILKAAIETGHGGIAALFLAFLALAFVGVVTTVLNMTQGPVPETLLSGSGVLRAGPSPQREPFLTILPPVLLGLALLALGVYLPPALNDLLREAAATLGAP